MEMKQARKVYIDYLRIAAIFAVIMIHVASFNWHTTNVNELPWQIFNLYDSMARWGVPVFVMISGTLFLGRKIPLKKLYSKYILRLVCAFAVWSLFYSIIGGGSTKHKLFMVISGHYHMWFIFMMIGLYICIPLLQLIVNKGWKTQYYLALAFLFAFVIPEIVELSKDFGNDVIITGMNAINGDVAAMSMNLVLGYSSFFILGYCLNQIELNKKHRCIVYFLGIIGFLFTAIVNAIVAIKTQEACGKYYGDFCVNVLFESIAVFVAFKYSRFLNEKTNHIAQSMAKYSFGAYLVHPFIITLLNNKFGLNTLSFNPILSVIMISIIVFVISFCISAILNKIPIVNKYLV